MRIKTEVKGLEIELTEKGELIFWDRGERIAKVQLSPADAEKILARKSKPKAFDLKIKVGKMYEFSFEKLVSEVLEPMARGEEQAARVFFVDGKIFFYPMSHHLAIENGCLVERVHIGPVYWAEMSEYKKYIAVKLNGKIRLLDSLGDVSGDEAIISVMRYAELNPILSAVIKKWRKAKSRKVG